VIFLETYSICFLVFSNSPCRETPKYLFWRAGADVRRFVVFFFLPPLEHGLLAKCEILFFGVGRKLANAGQIRRWLVAKGYTACVLLFELLPCDAQVEAARDADVLIAPHGSTLGWMTVMPRGGVVIEASVMTTRTD
jgi:hypothetical protein